MNDKTKSIIYALLTVLLWGSVPMVSKLTLKTLDFFAFTAYSLFFSCIFMIILVFFQKKIKMLKKHSPRDYGIMALMGIFGIFLPYLLYFGGINFASAGDAQILNNTWQIFAIFFAFIFLREKITIKKTIAIILGFIGACLIFYKGFSIQGSQLYLLGLFLALGSALADGLFFILGKKLRFDTWFSLAVYYVFAAISSLAIVLYFSELTILSFGEFLGVLYIGIFGIALPVAFMFKALKLGDTSKIVSISYLSPFLGLIFAYLFLGDKIYALQVAGLAAILLGIIISHRDKKN